MKWWKGRKEKLAAKQWAERMRAIGWEIPVRVKWPLPDVLQFRLLAHDATGEMVNEWYLGTRARNESDFMFMLVAYGLTEAPERIVTREEAVQIWSKWLSIPVSPIPWLSWEATLPLYKDWVAWANNDIENWEVAEEQIAVLPSSITFKVSTN